MTKLKTFSITFGPPGLHRTNEKQWFFIKYSTRKNNLKRDLEERNQVKGFGKTRIWKSRRINIESIFGSFWLSQFQSRNGIDIFLIQYYSKSRNFSIDTKVDEVKPVGMENHEFEYRDSSSSRSFWEFSGYQDSNPSNKNQKYSTGAVPQN